MKKISILLFTLLIGYTLAQAQDNPMRIGLKFGVPNVAGLHLEYVTPLLDGRLAPTVDITYIPLSLQDADWGYGVGLVDFNFSYLEVGANYYFFPDGRWLYANLSYGRLGLKYHFIDYYSEDSGMDGGTGKLDLALNLMNLKIGAVLGSRFYFRPELGIAIIGSGLEDIHYTITYPDGSTETVYEDTPEGFIGASPVINIGFGFAF